MKTAWPRYTLLFLILVFLQVWVFNRVYLFGFILPLPYVYFFLKLPFKAHRNQVLFGAFFIGFCIDCFSNTPGLHALTAVLVVFFRHYLLQLIFPREEEAPSLSMQGMGSSKFIKNAVILVLMHHSLLFSIESVVVPFSWFLLLKILGSSLLTLVLVLSFELFTLDGKKA